VLSEILFPKRITKKPPVSTSLQGYAGKERVRFVYHAVKRGKVGNSEVSADRRLVAG